MTDHPIVRILGSVSDSLSTGTLSGAMWIRMFNVRTATFQWMAGGFAGVLGALMLGRLQAHIDYSDSDLATLAAVLAHGIAEGQHFLDGNKRTAFAATVGFLALNGSDLNAPDDALAQWIIELSAGPTVADLAVHIRNCLTVLPSQ